MHIYKQTNQQKGINCEYENTFEMELRLWQKIGVNSVINSLTALYRVKNGALFNVLQHLCNKNDDNNNSIKM